jgi:hypothetical protein
MLLIRPPQILEYLTFAETDKLSMGHGRLNGVDALNAVIRFIVGGLVN